MHGVHKCTSVSGHVYAQGAETKTRSKGDLCTMCRNPPQIQGTFMPGGQKPASDSGLVYAQGSET